VWLDIIDLGSEVWDVDGVGGRCLGDDVRWLGVAVANDDRWQSVMACAGNDGVLVVGRKRI
jgi:hypothetical protein